MENQSVDEGDIIVSRNNCETDEIGCVIRPTIGATDIISFRNKLMLTQAEFAKRFDISIDTLRKWEQGKSKPIISLARLNFYNSLFEEKQEADTLPINKKPAKKIA